ncbi:MAG TPA: hypothetical protein VNT02_03485 [Burkholderiales bacterium]|nr:hypothetical protein [Burkholderiales bacterium]
MDMELGPLFADVPQGSDDIIDAVARIEMERQERAREVGNAAACATALRDLRTLHASEKEALRGGGPSSEHSANLAALAAEIRRVEKMSGTNRMSLPEGDKRASSAGSQPGAQRPPVRNNGRQNVRRKGGRQR